MSDNSREYRRVRTNVSVYYKKIEESNYEQYKKEIESQIVYGDSIDYLMSKNNLDTSYGSLNKAFVLIMKSMDEKLNYLVDLLKGRNINESFKSYRIAESYNISASGISIVASNDVSFDIGDTIFLIFSLPIASHIEIKAIGKVVNEVKCDFISCYDIDFLDIDKNHVELLIHYSLFVERNTIKKRILE